MMDESPMMDESVEHMKTVLKSDSELYQWFMNWDPDESKGYMWSRNQHLDKLSDLVNEDGHSGASFAVCCRLTKRSLLEE